MSQSSKKASKLEFFNGFGGFAEDGKEYEIILEGGNRPPSPWINIIANKNFGFTISESGAGFTWAYNSRENRLTPWTNDPVCDSASEAIYIKDQASGRIMTPTSLGKTDRGTYRVRHGFGYSKFSHVEENMEQHLLVFVPPGDPAKLWELRLANLSGRERRISITYYVEWVLGLDGSLTNPYVVTSYDSKLECLCARNVYNSPWQNHMAFIFSSEAITAYTGDRQEFLGPRGSVRNPQGLDSALSCNTGACYDPCGAIQVTLNIKPRERKTILFALGYAGSGNEMKKLLRKYRNVSEAQKGLEKVKTYWNDLLGVINVKTPDRALDILVNGWLLYQALSCRMLAKGAFYQCGGAYGYRDQLQDALSFEYANPGILKEQIILAAGRQFEEGDVQHWWHSHSGAGVRTRISDDLLWLPYATAAYVKSTGDYGILGINVPYLKGPPLEDEQKESLFIPEISGISSSIYDHCKKALLHVRFGVHGLPLMGSGDWNDGMNEVGAGGTGESVWLGWFLYGLLGDFIPICRYENDVELENWLEKTRESLACSMEKHAWDGEWYLRAFYDDYSKIGSRENDECKIDSISQSWAIISRGARKDRAARAFQSAWRYLVIEKDGISLLLSPPFDKSAKNPGYIKNYYPGVRENGGQYTHAAVWLAIAAVMIGENEKAYTLFSMLNPIRATSNRRDALKYEREPYVMAADISYNSQCAGKGGWSWYTGSAGWMYRGLVKWLLGIEKESDQLAINPATPEHFGDYTIRYRYGKSIYTIKIAKKGRKPASSLEMSVDGIKTSGCRVRLVDDGKCHQVVFS